jgi:histidine triad (HIT) family protein
MTDSPSCVFCKIARGDAPAFVVYEDDSCIAFLDLRPVREGHTMVIPKDHVDHFMDLDPQLGTHILAIARQIAHKIRDTLKPPRVGYVVAGFGVPHAHLHVLPMWGEQDITSSQYLDLSQNPATFRAEIIPIPPPQNQQKILDMLRLP